MAGTGVTRHQRLLALSVLAVCAVAYCYGERTECYVDEEGDKTDPNNIYKCAKDHTCCREEGKTSCCRTKDNTTAIKEQATLWGILIGGIIILALVMWCCRHDGDCCCNAKDGRKSCCGTAYGKRPEDNFAEGYGISSDSDDETDSDEDNDGKPPKKQPAPPAPKRSPEKKPPAPADEKKPPPSPDRSAPPSPKKDTPPSPAKKHLPSPEKLPNPPSNDNPPDMSQMKLDEIP